jgi:hypothetical protein
MRPYIEKHFQELHERIQDQTLIMKQHKCHFTAWLKDTNIPIGETPEENDLFVGFSPTMPDIKCHHFLRSRLQWCLPSTKSP